ncbi:hypothetical protein [Pedobacter frigidisoli]|uniref:hypothetical protein n=1 Tax=Pedobacter frigidisoli TaxID=2530455 RepID=UPI00292E787A|nr:hypothetical protein [Pedobacter frigidisoli]
MKNQSINSTNSKPEFLDIKSAKNPFYQPLAGKANLNNENKSFDDEPEKEDLKKDQTAAGLKTLDLKINNERSNSPGTVVQLPQDQEEKIESKNADTKPEKPAMNLESTLKLVEELHRRMVQRGRLVHTIDNLDKFEIEQKEEAEDITSNYYQGCEIEITDDKRNKFSTKNPVIIKAVAQFVRELCTNRLAEIEAEITIPA